MGILLNQHDQKGPVVHFAESSLLLEDVDVIAVDVLSLFLETTMRCLEKLRITNRKNESGEIQKMSFPSFFVAKIQNIA